jgi:oligopeptide/dipeptide ABC transporter ATP-binding protein
MNPLLDIRELATHFPVKRDALGRPVLVNRAVDGVDLQVRAGETLGLVGESGCGKTTLGRTIIRVLKPTAGQIIYRDPAGEEVDLAKLSGRAVRPYQRQIRLIFQDPFSSLNPRMTLLQIIGDPLVSHGIARGSELEDRVAAMLRRVGLAPQYMRRYPHAFSGGERQRVNIARALILEPRLVIADEPVSALDVSVRAQILNLLRDLQEDYGLTYIFISHDLSVVENICDRVAVMYFGRIVELAETADLYARPRHPYTEALLSAVPIPDPAMRDAGRRIRLPDDLPDPTNPPPGCSFHTRCPYVEIETCAGSEPPLRVIEDDHRSACHFAETLDLAGVSVEASR